MKVINVQASNNQSFGTRYGSNLTKFLNTNKEILSNQNYKNISRIRNNGINSVLELEQASLKDIELNGYQYNLTLKGEVFDRKNTLISNQNEAYKDFQDYIAIKYKERPISNKRFSIPVKRSDDTSRDIVKLFDDKNLLAETIEKEYEQSKLVDKEYTEFIARKKN